MNQAQRIHDKLVFQAELFELWNDLYPANRRPTDHPFIHGRVERLGLNGLDNEVVHARFQTPVSILGKGAGGQR